MWPVLTRLGDLGLEFDIQPHIWIIWIDTDIIYIYVYIIYNIYVLYITVYGYMIYDMYNIVTCMTSSIYYNIYIHLGKL